MSPQWPTEDSPLYVSAMAATQQRHIVPEVAERQPFDGRLVVIAECGGLAWCPRVGPFPSPEWPVCSDCARIVSARRDLSGGRQLAFPALGEWPGSDAAPPGGPGRDH